MTLVLIIFLLCSFQVFWMRLISDDGILKSAVISVVTTSLVVSLIKYWSLRLNIESFWFILGILLLIIITYFNSQISKKEKFYGIQDVLVLAISAFLIIIGSVLFLRYSSVHGGWDGWAIWNLQAKFLLSENWINLFDEALKWTHPDYPKMLPAILASLNEPFDSYIPAISRIFHYLIYLTLILAVVSNINLSKLSIIALVVLFTLDIHFIARAASQYADTLLALLILISVIKVISLNSTDSNINISLTAILCSSSMWVKNEGIIFSLLLLIYLIYKYINRPKNISIVLLSYLPVALTLIHFKLTLAPSNELFELEEIHWNAITSVGKSFGENIIQYFFPLVVVFVYWLIYKSRKTSSKGIILLLILTFYLMITFMAYLVTPYNIEWHINTSMTRIIHQVYPAILVVLLHEEEISKLVDERKSKI